MLGELFAEDYTWLHGNRFWRPDMPVPAPGDRHLGRGEGHGRTFNRQLRRHP